MLLLYGALLGLEIGGGTLQNTGLVTAIWLTPHRDIPYGLNSSFFFPLIGLGVLLSLIITAIVGRKSPREVKRPMYSSFGIWIIIAVATASYFIPNHPPIFRPGRPLLTVAEAAQRLETWAILDIIRQALGIVAFVLALKAYGAACRLGERPTAGVRRTFL
jgi:hypothetical protein